LIVLLLCIPVKSCTELVLIGILYDTVGLNRTYFCCLLFCRIPTTPQCPFFGSCIVCLLLLLITPLVSFTASDYTFGIFKLFFWGFGLLICFISNAYVILQTLRSIISNWRERKDGQNYDYDKRNITAISFGTDIHTCTIKVNKIYPIELEIKETAGAARSASYLDQNLEIDRWLEEMISLFPLWTFRLNVATFQQYLHKRHYQFSVTWN
jgi:hypothetical protein